MCCQLSIKPLDKQIAAAILHIGQFHPPRPANEAKEAPAVEALGEPTGPLETAAHAVQKLADLWQREIPEENTIVKAVFAHNTLEIYILPQVSEYDHHKNKRIAASVAFEIAAKYAEKVNGHITQLSNVIGCRTADSPFANMVLARYPYEPLDFQRICRGFQEVLLGSVDEG